MSTGTELSLSEAPDKFINKNLSLHFRKKYNAYSSYPL